jgi:glutamate:Na+ symporter, ESS family
MKIALSLILVTTLLVCSKFLTFRLKKLIIPHYILAGLLGLFLGEQFLKLISWHSLSAELLPDFLVSIIFALVPFQIKRIQKKNIKEIKNFWTYSSLHIYFQWFLGLSIVLIFTELPAGFATVLPVGFIGGHSSAIAIGNFYNLNGWSEAYTLCSSSATVGFVISIIGGLYFINKGELHLKKDEFIFSKKSQLIKSFFLLAFIMCISFFIYTYTLSTSIPWFIYSFFTAHVVKFFLYRKQNLTADISKDFNHMARFFTQYLVAFAIITTNISILIKYKTPLILLFSTAIVGSIFMFKYIAPRVMQQDSFEKALMTWGWTTGIVAIALALNQAYTDEKKKDVLMQEFALCYILIAPLELLFISVTPLVIAKDMVIFELIFILVLVTISYKMIKSKT